ncbi:MAG: hypothetical protein AAB262_05910 [Elusimicrobiota bacterium]
MKKLSRNLSQRFNEFLAKGSDSSVGEKDRVNKEIKRVEREIGNFKRAISQGVDAKTFMDELREDQQALDRLRAELALLEVSGTTPKLQYDPVRLGTWTKSVRNALVTADFDTRREMVRKFVKKIVVSPDKSAKMSWDLAATLAWGGGQEVPVDSIWLTKNGCGGWI